MQFATSAHRQSFESKHEPLQHQVQVCCTPYAVQVEVALARLKDSSLDHDDHLVCLEALARLAWSDDSVRQVGSSMLRNSYQASCTWPPCSHLRVLTLQTESPCMQYYLRLWT